jgi:hypothetical protein
LRVCARPHRTDNRKSLEWLQSQVRPVVGRLARSGLMTEALEALGVFEEYSGIGPCMDQSVQFPMEVM